tara:strand:+ start:325 stop:477 length:153 start_codon:yes stop_codon:yes gene_type:complete
MYELVLNDEVIDRIQSSSLEQARLFFIQRKQMTEKQFEDIGYSVRQSTHK